MIEWEELSMPERQAVKMISEKNFLGFHRVWFSIMTGETWGVNWHHKYFAHCIDEIISGKRGSTIFNVPPGSGKTEMFSISAPAYSILKCAKVRNLNVSFSNSLVQRNSIRTKDIIKSAEFRELYPEYVICKDKADEWQVSGINGKVIAEVVSRSMSGQITGGRGGYITNDFSGMVCLDDPDKPEDMFSEVKRTKIHNILVNTLRSRRAKKTIDNPTPFVVIQQRLHIDDTTAFLMDKERGIGINFDLVKIPALINQEYIDSLPDHIREDCIRDVCNSKQINGYWSFWPSNESIEDLFELWKRSEYTFMSQYMQDPISLGGSVFNAEWFRFYGDDRDKQLPDFLDYRFMTADTAQKTKSHNDYSVICEWGVKYNNSIKSNELFLINMIRGKWEAPDLRKKLNTIINEAFGRNSKVNGNLRKVLIEDKSSGTGLIQELAKTSLPLRPTAVQRSTDKLTRALDAAPQIEMGRVYIPYGAPYITEFVSEHSLFTPNDSHKHDDIVDNTCDAVQEALLNKSDNITNLMFRNKR